MRTSTVLFLFFILFTSCSHSFISVHSDYVTEEYLASHHVKTPDPRKNCPPVGQRLMITWFIPREYSQSCDLILNIQIKFRNLEEVKVTYPLSQLKGTYVYEILNEDYRLKQGFFAYQVYLKSNDQIISEWHHQMWTEIIHMTELPSQNPGVDFNEENDDQEFVIPTMNIKIRDGQKSIGNLD